jgi:DNA-binding LacI/PurR family transcriptional regulator
MSSTRAKQPNSLDVARLSHVSRATVSYVLNGKSAGLVSDETRDRVYAAARQVGYRINSLAKGLKSGKTALIGVICGVRESSLHSRSMLGIHDKCYEEGYSVLINYLGTRDEVDDESLQRILDYRVAGIIRIVSDGLTGTELELLRNAQEQTGTPCILIDDPTHSDCLDSAVSDDVGGAMSVVHHLISLGHTRIGHVNLGNIGNRGRLARREGFALAMRNAGLHIQDDLTEAFAENEQFDVVRVYLERRDRPTAVFCTNDMTASLVREVAHIVGLRVPEDLAIAGYGNFDHAYTESLTTVEEEAEDLGNRAVTRILSQIGGTAAEHVAILGKTKLIVRGSTVGGWPGSFPALKH